MTAPSNASSDAPAVRATSRRRWRPARARAARRRECACFYEVRGVPTNSCILLRTREEALSYPRGDIRLALLRTSAASSRTSPSIPR